MSKISRRGFLIGAVAAGGGGLLAACAPRVIETEVLVPGESVEVTRVVEVPVDVEREVNVSEVQIVERIAGEPSWTAPDFSGREYMIWG